MAPLRTDIIITMQFTVLFDVPLCMLSSQQKYNPVMVSIGRAGCVVSCWTGRDAQPLSVFNH